MVVRLRDATGTPIPAASMVTPGAALEIEFRDGRVGVTANGGPKPKKPEPPKGSQGSLF